LGSVTLTIGADHPALVGHFPGAPIVPGVLLLDEMVQAAEAQLGPAPLHWRIGSAKFLKPVRPGETLTLEHELLPNGSLRFSLARGGEAVAQGVLIPATATAQADDARRHPENAAPRASGAQWTAERERGSSTLLKMMIWVALRLGRPPARAILYLIAAYFFAFAPAARRHAREYLRRALGREPSAGDRFRQVFAFASTILDRLYLLRQRFELLEVSAEGEELMRAVAASGRGALLLGAHLGSFEMMSAVGRRQPGVRVAMAMYEDNANRVRTLFGAGDPATAPQVIPLGHLEAMLRIRDCLSQGVFVGMLADRSVGDSPAQVVNFLGAPALFPSGPMRAAAALRCRVLFITCLYRGGNRYHVVFRPLADFSQPTRAGRERQVREAIERYVALLEDHCRSDPWNWFNFYDFWHGAPSTGEGAPPPPAPVDGEAPRGASV